MFQELNQTKHLPQKPTMIWDGDCGFCKYWITVWRLKSGDKITYKTFQRVAEKYSDIPLIEFKKASRFIETDGQIYNGPDSAYKSLSYYRKPIKFPHQLYHKSKLFSWVSNHTYNFIAKHRPSMMKLTIVLFGKNPQKRKPYWIFWFALLVLLLITIFLV